MKTQKCCAHCPGKLVPPRTNESHSCCLPKYVSGNLRRSSLEKHLPGCPERGRAENTIVKSSPENPSPRCYDRFALAKRLHAENLEHQPLPDKVDDAIFKNVRSKKPNLRFSSRISEYSDHHDEMQVIRNKNLRFGPVLGCKNPETKMDLAICWETPINPVYEPPRSAHIDGSDGGFAPAIFSLVRYSSNSKASLRSGSLDGDNVPKNSCNCPGEGSPIQSEKLKDAEEGKGDRVSVTTQCCECLCKNLDDVDISREEKIESQSKRRSFRKCAACEAKSSRNDPRLIRSAVGLALGIQKDENGQRRNGLPTKVVIPRPKTPFARRSFCIDTLQPPFSVVNGCRDADYPEHWRLMSVYQQSYKNPQKRRYR